MSQFKALVSNIAVLLILSLSSVLILAHNGEDHSLPKPNLPAENNLPSKYFHFKPTRIRRYYIQAEKVEWNYGPYGKDMFMGMDFSADNRPSNTTIGLKYLKAKYIEYTDKTFSTKKAQAPHLGIVGPIIRAEVGEQIRILFKNALEFPAGIHPHGVHYDKQSEGAAYVDNDKDMSFATPGSGDAVAAGATFEYIFNVPDRAGPLDNSPLSSIPWMYHSHALDEPAETQAGLIGFIVITRKGFARKNGSPKDVDREFFVMPKIFDEQTSFFLDQNIQKYLNASGQLTEAQYKAFKAGGLTASNQKDSINGYMSVNNIGGFDMCQGERVRWYVGTIGNVDLHPVHWHGNVGLEDGIRLVDTVFVGPGIARALDMDVDNPGNWLFHCHIDNHHMDGMVDIFKVYHKHSDFCKK
ncbi:hypothetical protein NAEGRDRAFT_73977 [Naegleria gruberi]|uniref:Uncharacterized protein FM149 n=1 Tax=Naegleria gruberi TaxID=5762 RepID=D2VY54_NAEGR|nr:uncharacterized protein NAEGRDRAFT_73977 [Naegleria gruberi]EFC38264.1 hypothetical protein NAEGRDRAFT_73977 [Naegleria gruberi]|eukprot:XP_002671008.1 hypothetical protein NAEGRDRAFT_73977 [Naegleria gruberi strain NEG-M]